MNNEEQQAIKEAIRDIAPGLMLLESLVCGGRASLMLRTTLNSLPFPAWVKNEQCELLWVNTAYEAFYEVCCGDCLGKAASDRHANIHPEITKSDLEALETGGLVCFDDNSQAEPRRIVKLSINHHGAVLVFGVSLPQDTLANTQHHLSLTA